MVDVDPTDATAQDVVDALRFAFMAQKDAQECMRLVHALLEYAPETDNDRGIGLLLALLGQGALKVALRE